jgi:poly(3-hydroxybutyrate) depolymerase
LLLAGEALAANPSKETIGKHACYVYMPAGLAADKPAPLLMLFHGSNRDGMSQINEWRRLADKEGIILAAPNSTESAVWSMSDDGPDLFRDIAEFVGKQHPVDQRRIYAFGHSAGASFMLKMAPLESAFFAAVAVHAGQFSDARESGLLQFADRSIPLLIVIGTKDQLFPLDSVHKTRDAFAGQGFPIEVNEIPRHDHDYYRISAQINDIVWKFLSPQHLDQDARFKPYSIVKQGQGVTITPLSSD